MNTQYEATVAALDEKMVQYAELVGVSVQECGEEMVWLSQNECTGRLVIVQAAMDDKGAVKFEPTGKVLVRQTVAEKLKVIAGELVGGAMLKIVYGHRSLEVQTRLFEQFRAELSGEYEGTELLERIHKNIAVPEVSGHPTGGAVDVCLCDIDGVDRKYGEGIWQFGAEAYSFYPFVSRSAWKNRMELRQIMTKHGFAPYDGEWWHYSFGDREWAFFYGKGGALYAQLSA
jgi:zinc D-Ala-D-Ala dipeptidase